jgi:hypothetical protein
VLRCSVKKLQITIDALKSIHSKMELSSDVVACGMRQTANGKRLRECFALTAK